MEMWRTATIGGQWLLAGAYFVRAGQKATALPEKVATHFGLNGAPDGWGTKKLFLRLTIAIVAANAIFGTVLLAAVRQLGWYAGAIEFIATFALVATCWQAIDYNVNGKKLRVGTVVWPVVAIVGLTVYQLSMKH
jgi:hypothetical protein